MEKCWDVAVGDSSSSRAAETGAMRPLRKSRRLRNLVQRSDLGFDDQGYGFVGGCLLYLYHFALEMMIWEVMYPNCDYACFMAVLPP